MLLDNNLLQQLHKKVHLLQDLDQLQLGKLQLLVVHQLSDQQQLKILLHLMEQLHQQLVHHLVQLKVVSLRKNLSSSFTIDYIIYL